MELEGLLFIKDLDKAYVWTNGKSTRIYTMRGTTATHSLTRAIAILESQGYSLITDALWKESQQK